MALDLTRIATQLEQVADACSEAGLATQAKSLDDIVELLKAEAVPVPADEAETEPITLD